MRTGNYELVIVWENGSKDVYTYDNEEAAYNGGESMKMACGNQLAWWGVRPQMA